MTGFWYLASPYSKHPRGKEIAHKHACQRAAECFEAGLLVFSPIAHTHAIAEYGGLEGHFERWAAFDRAMIEASVGLIVLMDEGWQQSTGIAAEIEICQSLNKPVRYWAWGIPIGEFMLSEKK